jgi:hypothetical protein
MNLTLDLGTLSLIESPNDRRKIARIDVKRGDEWPVTLRFYNGTTPVRLPADTEIIFAAKENGKYDTTPVVLCPATDWTASEIPVDPENDTDPHYTALVNLNSTGLAELLGLDETSANDIKSVDLMAEITWQDPAATLPTTSATFILRVANDVWRGDEPTPLPLPTPDDWLGARAVRYDEEQDLAPEQQAQARANIDAASLDALAEKMAQAILLTGEQALPIYPLSVTVEGTLTDGTDAVVFPELFFDGLTNDRAAYRADDYQLSFDISAWILTAPLGAAEWASFELVETVDLFLDPFEPINDATGEATIVAHKLEAANVGQLCRHGDAAPYRWFVAETAGEDTVWREVFVDVDTSNVVSANETASVGQVHIVVATATITDPPPTEGAWYRVIVRNGTATVGGTAYATAGTIIERSFHSGSWANRVYNETPVLGANVATFLATPTSTNLAAAVTDETGTGSLVFANGPTLTNPVLNGASGYRTQQLADRQFIYRTTDLVRTSGGAINDDVLVLPVTAGKMYHLRAVLMFVGSGGATMTADITGPALNQGFLGVIRPGLTSSCLANLTFNTNGLVAATTNAIQPVVVEGVIDVSTSGNVRVTWGNTNATGNATIFRGSSLELIMLNP